MRILELFSGIGAVAVVAERSHEISAAVDINHSARQVYVANFSSPHFIQEIASLTDERLKGFEAQLWWMSPPCQPFTRRGLRRDLEDARTRPLVRIIDAIRSVRPEHVAVENVIGFHDSQAFTLLTEALDDSGYSFVTSEMCSSGFGLPNLRPRCFLAASRTSTPKLNHPQPLTGKKVCEYLDECHVMNSQAQIERWGDLAVDADKIETYREAVNVVTPNDQTTRCFTSAYGKSLIRSGSYLKLGSGYRRFSPSEVARLLGFPNEFKLPESLTTRQLWKLLGNTVSIPCARQVVSAFCQDSKRQS